MAIDILGRLLLHPTTWIYHEYLKTAFMEMTDGDPTDFMRYSSKASSQCTRICGHHLQLHPDTSNSDANVNLEQEPRPGSAKLGNIRLFESPR